MKAKLKVIAFDADDTLWVNEPYFQDAQVQFGQILREWIEPEQVIEAHYQTEIQNLPLFGYGIKGFTLSLIETAMRISQYRVSARQIEQIIQIGKSMLQYPVELLPEVETTLNRLTPHYRLILATKGDLLDQERKLQRSGISHFFHHIEVMSEKNAAAYQHLLAHLDVHPHEFAMVGNSLKSDILPTLEIGAIAFHVPYHVDWVHERVESFSAPEGRCFTCQHIGEVADHLHVA